MDQGIYYQKLLVELVEPKSSATSRIEDNWNQQNSVIENLSIVLLVLLNLPLKKLMG